MVDLKRELVGIYAVWLREFKRFYRDKAGFVSSIARPMLWLLILGLGIGGAMRFSGMNLDYLPFITPGIIAMSVLFTSLFSGISVIWDREFGFLKEMLVAPISRKSIIIGKSLGGSTSSIIQSVIIIILASLIGVQFSISSLIMILPLIVLISVGFVALGIAIASLMDTMEGFSVIMNFIVMPMFLLSGALFPISNLPSFVSWVLYINPMTYAVETLRYAVLGITSFNIFLSLGFVVAFAVAMSVIASVIFSRRK
jgi:ABC-2 type transport system permease protein